jgi:hypothetical protein
VWGSAGPVVRWLVGPNPPLTDDDSDDFKALFRPLNEPQYPAQVEPGWKLWKRRELRNPKAYTPRELASPAGQCLAGWRALRLIVGVYSPLSIAAIPPVIAGWFELGH